MTSVALQPHHKLSMLFIDSDSCYHMVCEDTHQLQGGNTPFTFSVSKIVCLSGLYAVIQRI